MSSRKFYTNSGHFYLSSSQPRTYCHKPSAHLSKLFTSPKHLYIDSYFVSLPLFFDFRSPLPATLLWHVLRYQRRAATRALGAYGTPSPRSSAIIPLSANSVFSVIGLASIQLRHLSVRIAHQTGIQPSLKFSRIALSLAQTPS